MPSNFTENYNLSQWERTDKVQMEDFNADNAKIDSALKAEADARSAADAALQTALNKKGNCRIWTYSYTGTGTFGQDNPKVITFPARPALIFIIDLKNPVPNIHNRIGGETCWTTWGAEKVYIRSSGSGTIPVTWSGNSMSIWYTDSTGQFNYEGATYMVVALIAVS